MTGVILVVNAGSSSLKFEAFDTALTALVSGLFEGIGTAPHLKIKSAEGEVLLDQSWNGTDAPANHRAALAEVTAFLGGFLGGREVAAIGHRVVHGGPDFAAPVVIDASVRAALEALVPLAPLHQPHNLAGIDAMAAIHPGVPQVACFDTGFHRGRPFVADTFALPRALYDQGIRRYGFHGLSYEFIARELRSVAPAVAGGRVVVAHLGNGASMCGLLDGRSMDSTMGFTALDGLAMGTRCGQLDPGVLLHLMTQGMDAKALTKLLYNESGLKGLSGISHDMRDLDAAGTPAAHEAIAYFVRRCRRELGGLAAILGGIDALVFTAGIGENSASIRAAVCEGMDWLGIEIDPVANSRRDATVLSTPASRVVVLRIPTDEEGMIARHALDLVGARQGVAA